MKTFFNLIFALVVSVIQIPLLYALPAVVTDSTSCFIIKVIDMETRRGVPMVELTTTSKIKFYTDSNGIICFNDASLMNQDVYFEIFSHGYESPGNEVTLKTVPGKSAIIEIKRLNIAERLYRITGQDIYGESVRAGLPVPIRQQGLNGKVTGQDTFIETLYKGKIYWFWGDTFGPASFNGSVSGAISDLPWKEGLNPDTGIDLKYFVDSTGLNKPMCDIPGPGLVWIDWLAKLPDENGRERLFAKYTRTKNLDIAYERGIAVFDDSLLVFKSLKSIDEWLDKVHSSGHPVRIISNGQPYFYIFDRYGLERVPADHKKMLDPGNYERFTCLKPGSKFNADAKIERNDVGSIVYAWKTNTEAISTRQQYQLMDSGLLAENESWFNPLDMLTGKKLDLNPASVFWNDYRKRWIMIGYEFCGQVWFLEADTPTGPWVYGRKVVSHDNYDFYNVGQHPLFDEDGGRIIYFEGTYTRGFSGNPHPTPLYDYNQMMYRLSMDDKRLSLPVPVYHLLKEEGLPGYLMREAVDSLNLWREVNGVPFFAIPKNRKLKGLVPVYLDQVNGKYRFITAVQEGEGRKEDPLFYGLPNFIGEEDQISGTWECEADGYPFTMDLRVEGNEVTGRFDDPSLLLEKGILLNDSIRLIIKDSMEQVTNVLTAQIANGQLNGRYEGIENNDSGSVTGEKRTFLVQKLFSSPAVAPLYEFQSEDGEFYYSTDSDLPKMKRSEQPICLVWRNPSTTMALDFEAKPGNFK